LANSLSRFMNEESLRKLKALKNIKVEEQVTRFLELCKPAKATVITDSPKDIAYVRQLAIDLGEEAPLKMRGHTIHYDGYYDQARDKENTRVLLPEGMKMTETINTIDREEGLNEVLGIMDGAMKGKECLVRFFSLGPTDSRFTQCALQLTDSVYVAHSEDILYRNGYEEFKKLGGGDDFFTFIHSAGELDERNTTVNVDKRRIYIDVVDGKVYTVNNQYAGNSLGLKKLALRLSIYKSNHEDWLTEHMLIMGVRHPDKDRVSYFTGAYPSACGKTSTAMLPGETILADDIAYFRNIDGSARAVNAEFGIFGIIQNVNSNDDPSIYKVLTSPGEIIFSNILVKNNRPYWLGMGCELPKEGINFSGAWHEGKTDNQGNKIPLAHKNARYAVALRALEKVDPQLDNPMGVKLAGIMYGGRDPKGYLPVQQGFDWQHGIIAYGASLETETTFAILGQEGVSEINLMSIQDFVSIPLGKYIRNNLQFGKALKKPPVIFGVNYFLRDKEGKFLNSVRDKHVWVKWMELRIHNEVEAIQSPTGWIPKYEDLRMLFGQVLKKKYSKEDYIQQFTTRVPENIAKLNRVEKFHRENVADAPDILFEILNQQRQRLIKAQKQFGDYISPEKLS